MEYGIWYSFVIDHRFVLLQDFVNKSLHKQVKLEALNGDASFRRYYRGDDIIALDSPPDTQKNQEFITLNHSLHECNLNTFNILHQDCKLGLFILEDLGDSSLFNCSLDIKHQMYLKAIDTAIKLALNMPCANLPVFDKAFIDFELSIFTEYMLDKALGLTLSNEQQAMLKACFEILANNCLAQKQCAMHRDFHSRNLMLKDNQIYLIDYQDMVKGPLFYDLASLLFDCYVKLEDDYRLTLLDYAYKQLIEYNLIDANFSFDKFCTMLKLTAMQRQVKVLGIFCRLSIRDGKHGYLKDLKLVLDYVLEFCDLDERFTDFKEFLLSYVKGHLPT